MVCCELQPRQAVSTLEEVTQRKRLPPHVQQVCLLLSSWAGALAVQAPLGNEVPQVQSNQSAASAEEPAKPAEDEESERFKKTH